MKKNSVALFCAFGLPLVLVSCSTGPKSNGKTYELPQEVRLKNLRQLTSTGTNAEAYWSFDGNWLTLQHRGPQSSPIPACDQIYRISKNGGDLIPVSTGEGRTTCSYYFADDSRILYASTHADSKQCPPNPDMSKGYVWPVYPSFQMYSLPANGAPGVDLRPLEAAAPNAYNAEATVCKNGKIVFTSDRDGDLELYIADLSAKTGQIENIKRVTHTPGYDGGAFFSQDCSKLVWRASRPRPGKELGEYQKLLKEHLVRPSEMEIWTADADGANAHQVTTFGAKVASFAPYLTPDNQKIIFASNLRQPGGRFFDLFLIDTQGTNLERVTYSDTFESFAMFSPDGESIAFSSNRNNREPRDTNLYIADWESKVEGPKTRVTADDFMDSVKVLSSKEFEGRGVGTEGLKKAEAWVEDQFRALGLAPGFEGRFFQEIKVKDKIAHNIVGSLGGSCKPNTPAVVIGAHLDHLGLKKVAEKTHVFFGADDNASGVAGVLELAKKLVKEEAAGRLTFKADCLYFVAFTGEESGVIGSSLLAKYWIETQKQKIRFMFNFDMIGRLTNNQLFVFGADSALEFKKTLIKTCEGHRLACKAGGDGFGPSDQMPFYQLGVPVLYFFTGPHLDHHAPTDEAFKINATGGVQIVNLALDLLLDFKAKDRKLTYQKPKPGSAFSPSSSSLTNGSSGGRKISLGTIPDYVQLAEGETSVPGVKLTGARPKSPADKAGIQPGDILIAMQGAMWMPTRTLEEFSRALSQLEPGKPVKLQVLRGEKTLLLEAIPEEKKPANP